MSSKHLEYVYHVTYEFPTKPGEVGYGCVHFSSMRELTKDDAINRAWAEMQKQHVNVPTKLSKIQVMAVTTTYEVMNQNLLS